MRQSGVVARLSPKRDHEGAMLVLIGEMVVHRAAGMAITLQSQAMRLDRSPRQQCPFAGHEPACKCGLGWSQGSEPEAMAQAPSQGGLFSMPAWGLAATGAESLGEAVSARVAAAGGDVGDAQRTVAQQSGRMLEAELIEVGLRRTAV